MSYPSITQQFESLGKDFNKNIPRVVIGNPNPNPNPKKPLPQNQPDDELNRELFFKKIEFWIFSIVIAIVLGYAAIRLIDMFLK